MSTDTTGGYKTFQEIFNRTLTREEEIGGVKINEQTGEMTQTEMESADNNILRVTKFFKSTDALWDMVKGENPTVEEEDGMLTAVSKENEGGFGPDGTMKTRMFICPECGKKVRQLLKNGYCSKGCAAKAKAAKAQAKVVGAMESTLDVITQIKTKLALLDAVLNVLTELPEIIRIKAKLPEPFREYVTLRIDDVFMRMKFMVNLLMIQKNDLIIELLKKVKNGQLDKTLESVFTPIRTVMTTAAGIQTALNTALSGIIELLEMPINGPVPPESMGWFLTAKSIQHPAHASEICIPLVPEVNKALPKWGGTMIDFDKIGNVVDKAMPPIQEFEYFLPPEAFKIRYQLSRENGPRIKKMWESLEALMVLGADVMPPYKLLKLSYIPFVLAILTAWSPKSRECYGDFIFHGSV